MHCLSGYVNLVPALAPRSPQEASPWPRTRTVTVSSRRPSAPSGRRSPPRWRRPTSSAPRRRPPATWAGARAGRSVSATTDPFVPGRGDPPRGRERGAPAGGCAPPVVNLRPGAPAWSARQAGGAQQHLQVAEQRRVRLDAVPVQPQHRRSRRPLELDPDLAVALVVGEDLAEPADH